MMVRYSTAALVLSVGLALGACIDETAGPEVYGGGPGLRAGFDRVALLPQGTVGGRLVGNEGDSLNFEIMRLSALASGSGYQVWLVDANASPPGVTRIDAAHVQVRPDTVGIDEFTEAPIIDWNPVGELAEVSRFEAVTGWRNQVIIRRSLVEAAGGSFTDYTHVVFTIGGEAAASPLDSPAPLWYRFRSPTGAATPNGTARFGFMPATAAETVGWSAAGGGTVDFVNTFGFGARLERISRPPVGYYYELWLIDDDDPSKRTLLGDLATPAPELRSLRDADTQRSELVTDLEILAGGYWAEWQAIGGSFRDYTHLYAVLQPKAGAPGEVSPAVVFRAAIPAGLDQLPEIKDGIEKPGR